MSNVNVSHNFLKFGIVARRMHVGCCRKLSDDDHQLYLHFVTFFLTREFTMLIFLYLLFAHFVHNAHDCVLFTWIFLNCILAVGFMLVAHLL